MTPIDQQWRGKARLCGTRKILLIVDYQHVATVLKAKRALCVGEDVR